MFLKFCSALILSLVVFLSPLAADIVIRDTTSSAIANGAAFMNLTDNFLSSTPSIEIEAAPFARTITSLALFATRGNETDDYSNFEFAFGEVLSVNNYRAQDFGNAIALGQQYSPVGQLALGLSPTEINPIMVQGFEAEELIFTGLNIEIAAGNNFDLIIGAIPQSISMDSIGLVYSSGNEFVDRYSRGQGGLVPNLDFPLTESQYAVRVSVGVPEPNATFIIFGWLVAVTVRRSR